SQVQADGTPSTQGSRPRPRCGALRRIRLTRRHRLGDEGAGAVRIQSLPAQESLVQNAGPLAGSSATLRQQGSARGSRRAVLGDGAEGRRGISAFEGTAQFLHVLARENGELLKIL